MKLYEVPRNTKVVLKQPAGHPPDSLAPEVEETYQFKHIDGMYSYCIRLSDNRVVHIQAWAEVEVIK
jgi:hypothetical protein